MKLLWFHLMPYTRLPEDFAAKHASVWVDIEHHQNGYGLMPSPNLIAAGLARRTSDAALVVMGNCSKCLRIHVRRRPRVKAVVIKEGKMWIVPAVSGRRRILSQVNDVADAPERLAEEPLALVRIVLDQCTQIEITGHRPLVHIT